MILCKLTDQDIKTHNGFKWVPGEWAEELSGNGELCSDAWYHCYEHPLLAILLNPIHANIKNPRLWLIEVDGDVKTDNGLKRGYRKMRLTEEIQLPIITIEKKVTFAILCAKASYNNHDFVNWADNWLSDKDRSAEAAARAAEAAAREAWTVEAAARAAESAAMAARAAAMAAWTARAAWTVEAVARAAWAAAEAVRAVGINLIALAEEATNNGNTKIK